MLLLRADNNSSSSSSALGTSSDNSGRAFRLHGVAESTATVESGGKTGQDEQESGQSAAAAERASSLSSSFSSDFFFSADSAALTQASPSWSSSSSLDETCSLCFLSSAGKQSALPAAFALEGGSCPYHDCYPSEPSASSTSVSTLVKSVADLDDSGGDGERAAGLPAVILSHHDLLSAASASGTQSGLLQSESSLPFSSALGLLSQHIASPPPRTTASPPPPTAGLSLSPPAPPFPPNNPPQLMIDPFLQTGRWPSSLPTAAAATSPPALAEGLQPGGASSFQLSFPPSAEVVRRRQKRQEREYIRQIIERGVRLLQSHGQPMNGSAMGYELRRLYPDLMLRKPKQKSIMDIMRTSADIRVCRKLDSLQPILCLTSHPIPPNCVVLQPTNIAAQAACATAPSPTSSPELFNRNINTTTTASIAAQAPSSPSMKCVPPPPSSPSCHLASQSAPPITSDPSFSFSSLPSSSSSSSLLAPCSSPSFSSFRSVISSPLPPPPPPLPPPTIPPAVPSLCRNVSFSSTSSLLWPEGLASPAKERGQSVAIPPGFRPVEQHTHRCLRLLTEARNQVSNGLFSDALRTCASAFYLTTFKPSVGVPQPLHRQSGSCSVSSTVAPSSLLCSSSPPPIFQFSSTSPCSLDSLRSRICAVTAECYLSLNLLELALEYSVQAVQFDSKSTAGYYNIAVCCLLTNNLADALRAITCAFQTLSEEEDKRIMSASLMNTVMLLQSKLHRGSTTL